MLSHPPSTCLCHPYPTACPSCMWTASWTGGLVLLLMLSKKIRSCAVSRVYRNFFSPPRSGIARSGDWGPQVTRLHISAQAPSRSRPSMLNYKCPGISKKTIGCACPLSYYICCLQGSSVLDLRRRRVPGPPAPGSPSLILDLLVTPIEQGSAVYGVIPPVKPSLDHAFAVNIDTQ